MVATLRFRSREVKLNRGKIVVVEDDFNEKPDKQIGSFITCIPMKI